MTESETAELSAIITPSDAEYELTWESSDETVATVTDGKVTAISEGTCTVIASTQNGLTDECDVIVENKQIPDIDQSLDWEGTYEMNAIVSYMDEDDYYYPTNFRMTIAKDTNGEYYVTSLIGFNILETYPYKGLRLNITSSYEAFISLKEDNDLGSDTEDGENYEGLHLLATSMQYSHENKGTVYLNRTSEDGMSITDFNVFLFGLSTDFEYVLKAQYTNCIGKKIQTDGIELINLDSVETDLIEIYSLDGKLIGKCLENEMPMLNKGIFIIRKGNKTNKIII